MPTPQARVQVAGHDVLMLGTIAGFVPDAARVQQAYEAFRPATLALGVPPEDVVALQALADAGPAPPELPELDDATQKLLALLAPFGDTRIPSPDLEAAYALARRDGVPVVALDLDDAQHAATYTRLVKFHHVVQSNSIKSRLTKRGVEGRDPYDIAAAWDAQWIRPKGLARVEQERERHMAERLREAAGKGSVLAVLPSVRLAGVVEALRRA